MNLAEDASLVHAGHGPTILATLRDMALRVLHSAGCHAIASQLRHYSQYPDQAVSLLSGPLPTHA